MSTRHPKLTLVLDAIAENRPQEATILARDALRSHPHDPHLHAALSIALCALGEMSTALTVMERAHYLAPGDPQILYNYGVLLEKMGRMGAARERLYGALKLDPHYDRALIHLAQLPPCSAGREEGSKALRARLESPTPAETAEPRETASLPGSMPEPNSDLIPPPSVPSGSSAAPDVTRRKAWWRHATVQQGGMIVVLVICGKLLTLPAPPSATRPASPPSAIAAPPPRSPLPAFLRRDHGRLKSARLAGSSFPGVDFDQVDLRGADLSRANLRGASFTGADLRGTRFGQAIMIGTVLRGADLESAYLLGANLWSADLSEANLRKVYLKAGKLGRARLDRADLRAAVLTYADLASASLRGANLSGANLRGADLSGADLRGARLHDADLRQVHLRRADLSGITYSRNTRWPAGFRPSDGGASGRPETAQAL